MAQAVLAFIIQVISVKVGQMCLYKGITFPATLTRSWMDTVEAGTYVLPAGSYQDFLIGIQNGCKYTCNLVPCFQHTLYLFDINELSEGKLVIFLSFYQQSIPPLLKIKKIGNATKNSSWSKAAIREMRLPWILHCV